MRAIVHITLKNGVLDPQGKAVGHALNDLGFSEVGDVRQGKFIQIDLDDGLDEDMAKQRVDAMCQKLLANPVIEDYQITIAAS